VRAAFGKTHCIVGQDARLPDSSSLARMMLEFAVRTKAATKDELWAAHAAELRHRLDHHDRQALHALSWLASAAAPAEVLKFDEIGWKEWKDVEFAPSYIVSRYEQKALTLDSPDLKEVLA